MYDGRTGLAGACCRPQPSSTTPTACAQCCASWTRIRCRCASPRHCWAWGRRPASQRPLTTALGRRWLCGPRQLAAGQGELLFCILAYPVSSLRGPCGIDPLSHTVGYARQACWPVGRMALFPAPLCAHILCSDLCCALLSSGLVFDVDMVLPAWQRTRAVAFWCIPVSYKQGRGMPGIRSLILQTFTHRTDGLLSPPRY